MGFPRALQVRGLPDSLTDGGAIKLARANDPCIARFRVQGELAPVLLTNALTCHVAGKIEHSNREGTAATVPILFSSPVFTSA
jgi:hypothetical protein